MASGHSKEARGALDLTHQMIDGLTDLLRDHYQADKENWEQTFIVLPVGDVPFIPVTGGVQIIYEPTVDKYDLWNESPQTIIKPGMSREEALDRMLNDEGKEPNATIRG